MVGGDGRIAILDFGLAKLLDEESGDAKRDGSPPAEGASRTKTLSDEMTREGKVFGTIAYMSPEQARGQSLDPRTDIFSFGVLLYEMLTGKVPFEGATPMDSLSAIIRDTPTPATRLNAEVPGELERIIEKCLEKDPSDRYQDSRDLVVDLKRLRRATDSQPVAVSSASSTRSPRRPRRWAVYASGVLVAVAGLLAAIALWRWGASRPGGMAELKQSQLTSNTAENMIGAAAISPDGRYLAVADRSGLSLRLIAAGETRVVPSPEGSSPMHMSWFPDGTRLMIAEFDAKGASSISSVSILTGARRKLRENAWVPAVSPDGSLVAFAETPDEHGNGIWLMDPEGGNVRRIATSAKEGSVLLPVWSPDGGRISYVRASLGRDGGFEYVLETVDVHGRKGPILLSDTNLIPQGSWPWRWWLPDGRIVFVRAEAPPNDSSSNLWQIRVDSRTGKLLDGPRRITSWAGFQCKGFSATSDGKRLAFIRDRNQTDVYVAVLAKEGRALESPRRLTLDDRNDVLAAWTPDSKSILFTSDRNGTSDVFLQDIGSPSAIPLVVSPQQETAVRPTADGSSFLFLQVPDLTASRLVERIFRSPLGGGAKELIYERGVGEKDPELAGFGCLPAAGSRCILGERYTDRFVISELDPMKGKGLEVKTIRSDGVWAWDVSPDGRSVALVEREDIRIIDLLGEDERRVPLADCADNRGLAWSHDASALFTTCIGNESRLMRVDLDGHADVLLQSAEEATLPLPSPDGRHLAYQVVSRERNVWMLENL
jgi:Tol biopolymer transport system component